MAILKFEVCLTEVEVNPLPPTTSCNVMGGRTCSEQNLLKRKLEIVQIYRNRKSNIDCISIVALMFVSFINDPLIFSDHSGRRLIQLMYETYNLVQIPTHQYRTESVYVGFVEK